MEQFELGQEVTLYIYTYDWENNKISIEEKQYRVNFIDIRTTKYNAYNDGSIIIKETTFTNYVFGREFEDNVESRNLNIFENLTAPYYSLIKNDKVTKSYINHIKTEMKNYIKANNAEIEDLKDNNNNWKNRNANLKFEEE